MTESFDFDTTLARLRKSFADGKTRSIEFRKKQLSSLAKFLSENESLIVSALKEDIQKPWFETKMVEIDFVLNDIRGQLFNIDQYATPQAVPKTLVTAVDNAFIQPEPYGLVLVIGAWNYPIQVTLSPLVGAIAAGITSKMKFVIKCLFCFL